MHLVVVREFAAYVRGEVIKDAEKIAEILASEFHSHVVTANTPEAATKEAQ